MKTSIPESPPTPEQTEQLRALVIDYLRDRITAEPATYVGRGRTREALLLEPLEHAQAIARTWSVADFLEFLDLDSPVYLQSVVDHLGFDPRTGRALQRTIASSDDNDTLIKLRTSSPLSQVQKQELMAFLARSFALSGRTEVEVI